MVHYAWHPLHGREVGARTGERYRGVIRCFVPNEEGKAKLLPEWMLDEGACSRMRVAETANVNVDALEALVRLLVEARAVDAAATATDGVVHAPNRVEEEGTSACSDGDGSEDSAVGNVAKGVPATSRRVARKDAEQRRQRRHGGAGR